MHRSTIESDDDHVRTTTRWIQIACRDRRRDREDSSRRVNAPSAVFCLSLVMGSGEVVIVRVAPLRCFPPSTGAKARCKYFLPPHPASISWILSKVVDVRSGGRCGGDGGGRIRCICRHLANAVRFLCPHPPCLAKIAAIKAQNDTAV